MPIVPCLFEEKRGDIVFGITSFRPPLGSRYLVLISSSPHSLMMCILFGYNPRILCCHFFNKLNLAMFKSK